MSMKLLYNLNGTKNGAFRQWLDTFHGEPRIAWYPSADKDFRALLYLHSSFSEMEPATQPEPKQPDIFLYTDYYPWNESTFLDTRTVHRDARTTITVKSIEELPPCRLALDNQIVDCPKGSKATGRVIFLNLEIKSDILGIFTFPVIYAFSENAAFCANKILANDGILSHIIHVRFGGCLGGGKSSGIWILNVLQKVKCEVLVSDNHYSRQSGDKRIYQLYPSLAGNEDTSQYEQIRTIASERWSYHGDVSWNIVKQN